MIYNKPKEQLTMITMIYNQLQDDLQWFTIGNKWFTISYKMIDNDLQQLTMIYNQLQGDWQWFTMVYYKPKEQLTMVKMVYNDLQ
jgi:hypothetical protein